jgi:hypothetical protein
MTRARKDRKIGTTERLYEYIRTDHHPGAHFTSRELALATGIPPNNVSAALHKFEQVGMLRAKGRVGLHYLFEYITDNVDIRFRSAPNNPTLRPGRGAGYKHNRRILPRLDDSDERVTAPRRPRVVPIAEPVAPRSLSDQLLELAILAEGMKTLAEYSDDELRAELVRRGSHIRSVA